MRPASLGRAAAAGLGGVVALLLLIRVCVGIFVGEYDDGVRVSIETDRSGLLLEKNAVIKLRGVAVGHVVDIKATDDGAVLSATIDRDLVDRIPRDVVAGIAPATVFGPKVVTLNVGPKPGADRVSEGDVIQTARVSGEYNATFQALLTALVDLQPAKLNSALSSVADTLDGSGAETGSLVRELQAYLRVFNRSLPDLEGTLQTAPGVLDKYTKLTPALVGTLRNSGRLADLLADQKGDLAAFLQGATVLGNDVTGLLVRLEPVLPLALETLRPTLGLLSAYSPELPCLLNGIDRTGAQLRKVMLPPSEGGTHRNVHVQLGIGQALPAYRNPTDLPKVGATGGPNCRGLPVIDKLPPFVRTDIGTTPYRTDSDGTVLPGTPLGVLLLGEQLDFGVPGAGD